MTLEEYRKLLDDLKKAQGALNYAVCSDLQKLAGAESNSTKAKVTEAYELGLNDAWNVARALTHGIFLDYNYRTKYFGTPDLAEIFEIDAKDAYQRYESFRDTTNKKEFHIGDEVYVKNQPSEKFIVVQDAKEKGKYITLLTRRGYETYLADVLEMTGKKYTEFAKFMGEE